MPNIFDDPPPPILQPYECWGCSTVYQGTLKSPPYELQGWRHGAQGNYCKKCCGEIETYWFTYRVVNGRATLLQIATAKMCTGGYDWMGNIEVKEVRCHPYIVRVSGLELVTPLS